MLRKGKFSKMINKSVWNAGLKVPNIYQKLGCVQVANLVKLNKVKSNSKIF